MRHNVRVSPDTQTSAQQLPPLHLPVLPWRHPELLSEMVGDTVYRKDSFLQAIRLMENMGVPLSLGALGVDFPDFTLSKDQRQDFAALSQSSEGLIMRGVITCDASGGLPWQSVRHLISQLASLGWWGIEIRTRAPRLHRDLGMLATEAKHLGLHPSLSLTPAALTPSNNAITSAYRLISVDMTQTDFLIEEQLGMLDCDVVIAEVIDPTSAQRIDLEVELKKLVELQAGLSPQTRLGLGMNAAAFDFGGVAVADRVEGGEEGGPGGFGGAAVLGQNPYPKIMAAVHLLRALAYGKEASAYACAAAQLAQAAAQSARPLHSLPKVSPRVHPRLG